MISFRKFDVKLIYLIQADFYVFAPAEGNHLDVKVLRVKENSAAALGRFILELNHSSLYLNIFVALEFFKVQITELPSDRQLMTGQTVTIKITAVTYSDLVPHIFGEYVSVSSSQVSIHFL